MGESPQQVADGIRAVVLAIRAREPRAGIIVLGLLPRGRDPHGPFRSEIPLVNRLVAPLGTMPRVRFLDVGGSFKHPDGKLRGGLFLPDSIHPSKGGYAVLLNDLRPALQAFLGRRVP
jgi:beta-glucosidase